MKKSIGILYICTGPYTAFWEDFFNTFEENFLPNTEKIYFVFTDSDEIYMEHKCSRVKRIKLSAMPWPLVTLLRFDTFLSIREELEKCDYLMFSNANIVCEGKVMEEDFLPRKEMNEKMCFTEHPGYWRKKPQYVPYERSKKSLAYIPYNCGQPYIIGAMFCGFTQDFLEMSSLLKSRIEEDLKKNVIARWHDESHINRYIVGKNNYRLLSPAYCYPIGIEIPFERLICAVSKIAKFDVNKFKGYYCEKKKNKFLNIFKKAVKKIYKKEAFLYLFDSIRNKYIDSI